MAGALAAGIGALGTVSLAACGAVPVTPSTGKAETEAPQAQKAAASGAPVLIIYATQNTQPPISTTEQTIVNTFEEQNPNIKVKVQFWPGQNFYDKLRILYAAGQMPDTVDQETKQLPDFVFRGMVRDLTDMMKVAGIKEEDYWPNQWLKHHIKGKMWAFPLDSQDVVIFYNKAVFDKAGVSYPPAKWDDPSWTWERVAEIGTKLTQGSGASKVWAINISRWWVYSYPFVWSWGGTVTNSDHTKSTITMQPTVEAFQFRADLINKFKVHPQPADVTEGVDRLFTSGRLAMNVIWSPWAYFIKNVPDLKFDMAPMPTGKAGAFTRAPSDCLTIGSQTKNADAAFQFLRYLGGPVGLKQMCIDAGLGIPPLRALTQDFLKPNIKGLENLNWQVVLDVEAKQKAKFQDVTVKWPEMDKLINAEHDVLLSAKETAAEFAAKLDPQINQLLASIPEDQRGYIGD